MTRSGIFQIRKSIYISLILMPILEKVYQNVPVFYFGQETVKIKKKVWLDFLRICISRLVTLNTFIRLLMIGKLIS